MTNPMFVQADRLSAQAKRCSERGKHEEAIRLQQNAVEIYREIYNQRTRDPVDSEIDGRERNEVAHRLADHFGRLGGVYRRAGQLKPALDSYTHGADLETEWQLDDTYNRTNKIILALLLDPSSLPALIDEIEKTVDLVRRQIDRTRRDEWWAWADMGLLSLLAGRPRDARWAYDHFVATGARSEDYDSTMSVLRELKVALSADAPERSKEVAAAITHLETSCETSRGTRAYDEPMTPPALFRYPALYRAASDASMVGQNRYMQAIRIRLIFLVLAAVGGAISWRVGNLEILAWLALVSFVIALAAEFVIFALHPEQVWYEGRAAAESTKTLTWRYVVAGDPFPDTLTDHEADRAFLTQLAEIPRDLAIYFPPPQSDEKDQITDEMRQLRGQPFAERRTAYLTGRIDDQHLWYSQKSRAAERNNSMFLLGAITFEFVGVIAATLRVTGVIDFDLLGIVAALTAGIASWAQTRGYGLIARAYSIASNELTTIRSQASLVDDADWAQFVAEAEEAISREHTLWRASRGVRGGR